MNYVVLDLEWNQCPFGKERENPSLPFEILEIGAVLLNEKREILSTFSETICPRVYRQLHYRTRDVIGGRMEEFLSSRPFPDVCLDFLNWCGTDYVFCTWGPSDLPELQRNMEFYGIPLPFAKPFFYYDVQKLYSISFDDGKSRKALETAVEEQQIPKEHPFHRALDDTCYTALVLQRVNWDAVSAYYSVDYYRPPLSREEEVHLKFPDYTKYISRIFPTREDMMTDRVVSSVRCRFCGRLMKKQIRWFPWAQKQYLCVAECPAHGLQKGKIRIKKGPDGTVFAAKTIKCLPPDQLPLIELKKEENRKRGKARRQAEKQRHQA